MKIIQTTLIAFFCIAAFSCNAQKQDSYIQLETIKLPTGFKIEVWAEDVDNARSLAMNADGSTVFVGNRQGKNIYALKDTNGDGKADKKYTLASGLRMPNGVAFKDGDLYVAEVSRILRFKDIVNLIYIENNT